MDGYGDEQIECIHVQSKIYAEYNGFNHKRENQPIIETSTRRAALWIFEAMEYHSILKVHLFALKRVPIQRNLGLYLNHSG